MNIPPSRSLLDFALEATWQAGRITLGYFNRGTAIELKADNTPVTAADREAEREIRQRIARYWPEHAIVGEEYGQEGELSGLTWIIDPIDGTKAFICGVPFYGTLLALMNGHEPVIGVAHFPALGDVVYAARGEGCYWNGRRASVSTVDTLDKSVVVTSNLNLFEKHGRARAWQALVENTYIQRTWGDAYGYALVATGRAEIMVDPTMSIWDCGPHQIILEEAGGTFTDWSGDPTIFAGESIATNGVLFDQVMRLVQRSTQSGN